MLGYILTMMVWKSFLVLKGSDIDKGLKGSVLRTLGNLNLHNSFYK